MKTKWKAMTGEEIDRAVIAQAEDKNAWEKPVKAHRAKLTSVSLPATLAAKAAFFARLHRETKLENWLNRIIQERLDIEEAAFADFKRNL
ncbi:MAG: hypothetical protein HZA01_10750 [Nitrospinae bacterium]|nr:hypothetical protein [Nitrospinota bacterium]